MVSLFSYYKRELPEGVLFEEKEVPGSFIGTETNLGLGHVRFHHTMVLPTVGSTGEDSTTSSVMVSIESSL